LTKNKEKYARLMLFAIDVDHAEYEIWQTYDGDFEGISTFLVALNDLKQSGVHLSPNSLNILMLETVEEQLQFYENARSVGSDLSSGAELPARLRHMHGRHLLGVGAAGECLAASCGHRVQMAPHSQCRGHRVQHPGQSDAN
jgi:hypothetical protein